MIVLRSSVALTLTRKTSHVWDVVRYYLASLLNCDWTHDRSRLFAWLQKQLWLVDLSVVIFYLLADRCAPFSWSLPLCWCYLLFYVSHSDLSVTKPTSRRDGELCVTTRERQRFSWPCDIHAIFPSLTHINTWFKLRFDKKKTPHNHTNAFNHVSFRTIQSFNSAENERELYFLFRSRFVQKLCERFQG